MKVAVAALACATGCAQILGLDSTDRRDAGGPTLCDEDLECSTAPDRAVCGRLVDAVSREPFADPGATGTACAPGATTGPCAFAVSGVTSDQLFTGTGGVDIPAAVTDTCGRFRVEGLTGSKLAVITAPMAPADGTYRRVARTILYNDSGPIEDLEIPVVSHQLVMGWEAPAGVLVPEGLLLLFRNGSTPIDEARAKIESLPIDPPPASPFALYFAGPERFMTVTGMNSDGSFLQPETGPTGTAVLVPDNTNPFLLGGSQMGTNCTAVSGIQKVIGTLVYIDLTNC